MTTYGYMRISTNETKQDFARQEKMLLEAGCEKIFSDVESGSKTNRKELNELLSTVKENDCVITVEFSRIARSTKQLIEVAEDFNNRGVDYVSLTENVNTRTPEGKLFYTIIAGFAEFELNMIRTRTKQGLESARAKGRKGGRPRTDKSKLQSAITLYQADTMSAAQIADATGISVSTLYRELRNQGIKLHSA